CSLDVCDLRLRSWICRIDQETDQLGVRDEVAQQFQPFCRERVDQKTNPRDIAAGSAEAWNETEVDRIGTSHENDGSAYGCCLGRKRRGWGGPKDYRYGIGPQSGGQCRQTIIATAGRAIFDCNVAAFDIAGLLEALPELSDPTIIHLVTAEQADQRHWLLRARRDRPSDCRAAERG